MDSETLTLQFGQVPPAFCIGVPKSQDAITVLALQPHPDVRGPADHVPDDAILGTKAVLQFATVESLDVLISAAQQLRKQMVRRAQNPWCVYTILPGGLDASAAVGNGHLDLKLLAVHSASPAQSRPERPEATPGRGALKDKTDQELDAEIGYWENEIESASGWGAALGAADGFLRTAIAERTRRILHRLANNESLGPWTLQQAEVLQNWGRE